MPDQNELHAGAPLDAWEARMKEIVREVLREEGMTVPFHVREANHQFISECKDDLRAYLQAERLRSERREKLRTMWIGGVAVSITLSFLYWVGTLIMNALSHPAAQDAAQHLDKLPPR